MALKLTLVATRESRTLERATLSIGRVPGNDWVLDDPDRYLSKTHCFIAFVGGRYVLTDVSTNGVFINGARERVARDEEVVLNDGDEIRLGSHVMIVSEQMITQSTGPFADPADPVQAGPDPLEDPFGVTPQPGFGHRFVIAASSRPSDPFDRADEVMHPPPPDPDDDLFRGLTPDPSWQGPSQADDVDAAKQAFAAPAVAAPMSLDDIDALLGDIAPAPGQAPGQVSMPPPRRAPVSPPVAADPFAEPPPRPAPLSAAPSPAAASPQAMPALASGPTPDAARLLAAFLEGAGVAGLDPGRDPEAALRAAGEVFRAMVEGVRQVLISRAAIKNELRVEQTMLRARDNNPLKFSATDEDAIAALLHPGRPGYKPPLDAAREAFGDIRSHEMAVMAGVQTALMGLLRRFEPAALEKRLAAGMLDNILPASRRARTWELFCETYQQISREAEDDFQSVFGREFARAYDAQMQKL